MGTSSSSLESFAGAGAGASLSASDADAFLLVTRVPPRRPRAIVVARVVALRVRSNSHARREQNRGRDFEYDSLAFAGSTEARENARCGRPPLCGAAAVNPV